jgi:biotin carboxyl carrier protein
MKYHVTHAGRERVVEIRQTKDGVRVLVDGEPHPVDLAEVGGTDLYSLLVDGRSVSFAARFENGSALLSFHDRDVEVAIEDERTRLARLATGGGRKARGAAEVKSVMPGVVKEVRVAAGQAVRAGEALLILEAMKMENEIRAPDDAVVARVHVEPGKAVEKGALLLTFEVAADPA